MHINGFEGQYFTRQKQTGNIFFSGNIWQAAVLHNIDFFFFFCGHARGTLTFPPGWCTVVAWPTWQAVSGLPIVGCVSITGCRALWPTYWPALLLVTQQRSSLLWLIPWRLYHLFWASPAPLFSPPPATLSKSYQWILKPWVGFINGLSCLWHHN